jgi:cytochrome c oxidase subunit 3
VSAEAASHGAPRQHVSHQFENIQQQNECYIVGMWSFLVTEIMFFGALFLAYTLYRYQNPQVFVEAHKHLEVGWGALNTVILLTSSLTMALAVHGGQTGNRRRQINFMFITILFAFGFLGIKTIEYKAKFKHQLFPGPSFHWQTHEAIEAEAKSGAIAEGAEAKPHVHETKVGVEGQDFAAKAQMFFCLYFAMTGLHGIHVIIGILIMGTMVIMLKIDHPAMRDYMPTELAGLYWHFVDIVWIFLFPLYYLIPGS